MTNEDRIVIARETDRAALHRAHRRGEVARVRPGGYLRLDGEATLLDGSSREIAAIMAVHRQLQAPHTFSHQSAAALWGLRRWTRPDRTHLIQSYRASGGSARDLARHLVALPAADVTVRAGVPLTTRVRTVVDCALALHPLESLVIADHALGLGLARDEAIEHLAARGRVPGHRRAGLILDLAEAGVDSAWETWLRYIALRAGLPRPTVQHPVATRLGTRRVDVAWPEHGVLAEFDGRIKYRDGAFGQGYDADAARFEEKRRADAIEETVGSRLLRFTAADAPDDVARRLLLRFPQAVRKACRTNPRLPPIAPYR